MFCLFFMFFKKMLYIHVLHVAPFPLITRKSQSIYKILIFFSLLKSRVWGGAHVNRISEGVKALRGEAVYSRLRDG